MRYFGPIFHNSSYRVAIHIDIQNWQSIRDYLDAEGYTGKEFAEILEIIINRLVIPEKFGPLKVTKAHRDYFEMIFSQAGRDDRILCRKYEVKKYIHVILIKLYKQVPGENIQEKIKKDIIETGGYDYDIQ